MWTWIVALLCLTVANANKAIYSLPSFSLVLKVTKSDNALIVFQDRLEVSVKDHLNEFFKDKIETPSFGSGTFEEIALSSKLVWRELTGGDAGKDRGADPYQGEDTMRHFEVRGDYECQLSLSYNPLDGEESLLSNSIMELFLIEAFQGDNYWGLVHSFLSDEILDEITDVKITVISDGYVPNGQDPSAFNNYETGNDEWTGAMTVGVVFAAFFFFVLLLMWIYLCFFVRGTFLWKTRNPYPDEMAMKDDAATEPNSAESIDFTSEDEESTWMDAWANAITSIPIRAPIKTSKRKKKIIHHPAQNHNSYLDSINESGEDECSCASEDDYSQRRMTKEQQESMATFPCVTNTTTEVGEMSSCHQPKSRTKFNFGKTQAQFIFAKSQPQYESGGIC
jgi:hypothetical protein